MSQIERPPVAMTERRRVVRHSRDGAAQDPHVDEGVGRARAGHPALDDLDRRLVEIVDEQGAGRVGHSVAARRREQRGVRLALDRVDHGRAQRPQELEHPLVVLDRARVAERQEGHQPPVPRLRERGHRRRRHDAGHDGQAVGRAGKRVHEAAQHLRRRLDDDVAGEDGVDRAELEPEAGDHAEVAAAAAEGPEQVRVLRRARDEAIAGRA